MRWDLQGVCRDCLDRTSLSGRPAPPSYHRTTTVLWCSYHLLYRNRHSIKITYTNPLALTAASSFLLEIQGHIAAGYRHSSSALDNSDHPNTPFPTPKVSQPFPISLDRRLRHIPSKPPLSFLSRPHVLNLEASGSSVRISRFLLAQQQPGGSCGDLV